MNLQVSELDALASSDKCINYIDFISKSLDTQKVLIETRLFEVFNFFKG